MPQPRFIHLRVHTEYSLLEGAVRLKSLPKQAAGVGMPAVAVTDTNNLFCALEFAEAARAGGVQPIVGCQIDVLYETPEAGGKAVPPAPLVLLAQSETGYLNLLKLNTALYLSGRDVRHVTMEEVAAHSDGLICLTGGPNGPAGRMVRAAHTVRAESHLATLAAAFPGRLYVELQRHPGEDGAPEAERATERFFVETAYAMGLPLVATNDVHFESPEMFAAHDALICIAEGAYVDQQAPRRRLTQQHWLKPPSEMTTLFADLPEALENTVEIARRCAYAPSKRDPILPRFADDEVDELRRQAREGLAERLAVIPHAASVEEYHARLDYELGVIEGMGFPGYFLIVADFIKWAKERDIPVGPGRGSGAGSLVAYALTITDLDPLRYGLLFERFLNPERVSMPDFDIDFCMDRREEVIEYVQGRYGDDKVAQIITFGALLSKAAVRDVGRVLQMPYLQVDRLSKLIPVEGVKPVSIEKALASEERLRDAAKAEEVVDRLLTHAARLEGLLRNASTHAAGVVIGDRPLDELVPLYQDPRSEMPATQFNMKWVEAAGLVKFDFLGLKTLTVIQNAIDLIHGAGRDLHVAADGTQIYAPFKGAENDIGQIPLDDAKTYELYARQKTVAVFQVESDGMKRALGQLHPTCIEDIIALVALYRPGPMENIPAFCDVKNARAERASIHPSIDHILDETQGIIVYQEQVMQIAQEMAGYSLGGADLLRRAMGKKIQSAMDAERPKFIKGAEANGVDKDKAVEVWNLLDKFANYGFNKSHAAAYAVVSYQTAWLKANHPVEFMAGVMNCDIHLTDKLAVYAEEVRRGIDAEIVTPCVNRSGARFTVADGKVVYGLGALKGVGVEAMRLIEKSRGDRPFATLFDFARRVDIRRIGKRSMEMLARSGAFDDLDRNRRRVFEGLDALAAYSGAVHDQRQSAQVSLFGEAGDDLPEPRMPPVDDWLPNERLAEEMKAVGFYLTGHPLDDYMGPLRRREVITHAELTEKTQTGPVLANLAAAIAGRRERKTARGSRFAFVSGSDPTGLFEVRVWEEVLSANRDLLEPGQNVVMKVEAEMEGETLRLRAHSVVPVDSIVAEAGGMALRLFVDTPEAVSSVRSVLSRMADGRGARGTGPITFTVPDPSTGREIDITPDEEWPLTPAIRSALKSLPGVVQVEDA
jgi:DNA polymerase-3 subunit alpha